MSFWTTVGINVFSSLLFVAGAFVVALIFTGIRRFRLNRFFHIGRRQSLIAYLSRINIPPQSSVDAQGRPRNYSGAASPESEIIAMPAATKAISTLRGGTGLLNRLINFLTGVDYDALRFEVAP